MALDPNRPLLVAAGLCGAIGVMLAAAGSHGPNGNLSTAGLFLLLHAPALIGLSLLACRRLALIAGWVLVVALILFAGDLTSLALLGHSVVLFAAPIGGLGLIVGWLLVAATALVGGDARDSRT